MTVTASSSGSFLITPNVGLMIWTLLLFGISMLERLLRVAQRLGYREAVIVSKTPDLVATHLAKPSWARSEVALKFRLREADPVLIRDVVPRAERILLVSAGFYYDARLLKALSERDATTLLVDSAPPSLSVPLWKNAGVDFRGAALLDRKWLAHRQDDQFAGPPRVRPVPAAATPATQARNIAAWLRRYSR